MRIDDYLEMRSRKDRLAVPIDEYLSEHEKYLILSRRISYVVPDYRIASMISRYAPGIYRLTTPGMPGGYDPYVLGMLYRLLSTPVSIAYYEAMSSKDGCK